MYYCSPIAGKRFYLQLLLMSVPGPISFEDLCTIASIVYLTFQAACIALGLLEDNCKWIDYLIEAAVFAVSTQLCSLFVTALLYGPIVELVTLWDCFKQFIYNNLPCFLAYQPNAPPIVSEDDNAYFNYGLYFIYQILADYQKMLVDYGLPQFQYQWGVIMEGSNPLFIAKLQQYDPIEEECQFIELCQQLNTDQVVCFNTVVAAIDIDLQAAYFFL